MDLADRLAEVDRELATFEKDGDVLLRVTERVHEMGISSELSEIDRVLSSLADQDTDIAVQRKSPPERSEPRAHTTLAGVPSPATPRLQLVPTDQPLTLDEPDPDTRIDSPEKAGRAPAAHANEDAASPKDAASSGLGNLLDDALFDVDLEVGGEISGAFGDVAPASTSTAGDLADFPSEHEDEFEPEDATSIMSLSDLTNPPPGAEPPPPASLDDDFNALIGVNPETTGELEIDELMLLDGPPPTEPPRPSAAPPPAPGKGFFSRILNKKP